MFTRVKATMKPKLAKSINCYRSTSSSFFLVIWVLLSSSITVVDCDSDTVRLVQAKRDKKDAQTIHHRELSSSLADRFNIGIPNFNHIDKQFILSYEVSEYVSEGEYVKFELYDRGCKDNDGDPPNPVSSETTLPTTIQYSTAGDNEGMENIVELKVDINPETFVEESTIFETPDRNSGKLEFCVRLEIVLDESIVVNFLETVIVLDIDLIGDFAVGSSSVNAKQKKEKFGNQIYEVEAHLCDAYYQEFAKSKPDYEKWRQQNAGNGTCIDGVYVDPLADFYSALDGDDTSSYLKNSSFEEVEFDREWNPKIIYNQGSVVRICVRPNKEAQLQGIKMRRVEWFTFWRLDEESPLNDKSGGPLVEQNAVVKGGKPAYNGLTNYHCTLDMCVIETLLRADFYRYPGTTQGRGLAHLQFGEGVNGGGVSEQTQRGGQRNLRRQDQTVSTISWKLPENEIQLLRDRFANTNNDSGNTNDASSPTGIRQQLSSILSSFPMQQQPVEESRQLQQQDLDDNDRVVPLETYWNLTSSGFIHEGTTFQLSYTLSDAIESNQVHVLFQNSNCRDDVNNFEETLEVSTSNNLIGGGGGDGYGSQSYDIDIEFDPETVSAPDSNIYAETKEGNFAQIQFCLRLSLYKYVPTGDGQQEERIEVNFLENPVFLNVDLQSQIGVGMETEAYDCKDDDEVFSGAPAVDAFLAITPRRVRLSTLLMSSFLFTTTSLIMMMTTY